MEVSCQLQAPTALLQEKEPPVGGWMGSRASFDAVAKKKNYLPLPRIESRQKNVCKREDMSP
jgi:hypothetical protein